MSLISSERARSGPDLAGRTSGLAAWVNVVVQTPERELDDIIAGAMEMFLAGGVQGSRLMWSWSVEFVVGCLSVFYQAISIEIACV